MRREDPRTPCNDGACAPRERACRVRTLTTCEEYKYQIRRQVELNERPFATERTNSRTNEQPKRKRGMRRAGEGYGRLVPNERWAQGVSGYSERTIGDPPS